MNKCITKFQNLYTIPCTLQEAPSNNAKKDSPSFANHREKLSQYNINQKTALFTILLSIFIDVFGYSMILPLLPIVATQTFGASNFMVGILIASNAAASFISAPIWGWISDKVGRKGPLVVSQIGTLASFIILGYADSVNVILFSRILDGIFSGQFPLIRAFIIDLTDEKTRSAEMGRLSAGWAVGFIFGPSIGGLLGSISWRVPPIIASVLSFISIFFTLKYIRESMPKERRLEIKQGKEKSLKNNNGTKQKVLTPIVFLRLFQTLFISLAFSMIFSTFALVLNLRYGLEVAAIGLFSTYAGILMMIFGAVLMRPLIRRFRETKLLFFAIGLGLFVFSTFHLVTSFWIFCLYAIPILFMDIIVRSIIQTNLSKSVNEDNQGQASGYAANMFSISQIIGPLIGYYYLDIGSLTVLGITLQDYLLMGLTGVIIILIFLALVLIDLKYNPELFRVHSQNKE